MLLPCTLGISKETKMKCTQCELEATYVDKNRKLCDMHYRFTQMRQDTWTRLGIKHTVQELLDKLPPDLTCPECKVQMVWRRGHLQKGVSNQITLQHWRDGTIGFLCISCNVRHSSMEGDSYKDMPKDHKLCPKCNEVKPEDQFCLKSSRSVLKRNSICNPCNTILANKWKQENKEKNAVTRRAYYHRRIAEGNPIPRSKKKPSI